WRRRSAALGLLRRQGSPPATVCAVARPASVPLLLSSLLGSFAVYCGGALRCQGQALRVGLRPSLDTSPPQWRRCERREQRKNCRGPAAQRPSNPVARVLPPHKREEAQGNLDVPSQSHTRQGKQEKAEAFCVKKPQGKETSHAEISS